MPKGNVDSKLVTEDMLHEAVDAIFSGMQRMFDESNTRFGKLEKKVDGGFIETHDQIENLGEKVNRLEKSFASS